MKIKKVITIIALAPFVYLFLLFIGAFSFTVLDRYVSGNNYEKKADIEISNEKYKILVYNNNRDETSAPVSTYVTFIDKEKETSFFEDRPLFSIISNLPTRILDGDFSGINENRLIDIYNKKVYGISFIETDKVEIVLKQLKSGSMLHDSSETGVYLDTLIFDLSEYNKCVYL